jgi:hypothetical protein
MIGFGMLIWMIEWTFNELARRYFHQNNSSALFAQRLPPSSSHPDEQAETFGEIASILS